ncbi:hypothetical protein AB0L66_11505 [Streptomyces sp. NPDC052207]|uniref:hypothetical protein n=1 Tax=Streptomyces sp. NPDC052207 TaxID=3155418 RepID=UPI003447ABA0
MRTYQRTKYIDGVPQVQETRKVTEESPEDYELARKVVGDEDGWILAEDTNCLAPDGRMPKRIRDMAEEATEPAQVAKGGGKA